MLPWSGTSCSTRATTRARRRPHDTPSQSQKGVAVVRLDRTSRGSASWALKSSSAATSVSLPLPAVTLSGVEAMAIVVLDAKNQRDSSSVIMIEVAMYGSWLDWSNLAI